MRKIIPLLLLLLLFSTLETRAHVKLLYPVGGETFVSGEIISIEWSELVNHNGTNWELHYTLNDGSTWITISDSIAYSEREYLWTVPFEVTTMGRIKVLQNNPGVNYQDLSPNFTIELTTDIKQIPSSSQLYETLNIYPNPISNTGNFSFSINKPEHISFEFYSINGLLVDNITGRDFLPGSYTIKWNKEGLKPGVYFCVVRTRFRAKSYTLKLNN